MNEYINIFEESSCPSLEVLDHYLAQEVASNEQQKIETHLVDCPLCADALEGLAMVEDKKGLKIRLRRIKSLNQRKLFVVSEKKREQLSKRKSRVRPMKIEKVLIPAAAAIAALFVTVFIFFDLRNAEHDVRAGASPSQVIIAPDSSLVQIAEAVIPSEDAETSAQSISSASNNEELLISEKPLVTESKTIYAKEEKTTEPEAQKQAPSKQEIPVLKPVIIAAPSPKISTNEPVEHYEESLRVEEEVANTSKKRPKSKQKITKQDPTGFSKRRQATYNKQLGLDSTSLPESGNTAPTKSEDDRAYGVQTKAKILSQLMTEGQAFYQAGNYLQAEDRFTEILVADASNREAQYYLANTHFAMGNTLMAIKAYQKLKENELYGEKAQWMLALSFLKVKKLKQAKKCLTQIVDSKGKYTKEAEQKLKELE